ncbi:ribosome-associated heat shock protein Hsp15 [Sphingomonas laterariae]|uniref:Ribosome-associated heat shock protein Hsp15 n=1 Tax=Edaphosphingomonas laterariae TaxID=861865 RepID=A0A239HNL4_9SPHN|nr:RNA-binding S4 domain-containing protein [Sphingomonas laterariae]SNS82705.1 ribosome-associated heat shock protein Hsp15 [Sphingomonas laterariae]
MSEAIRIDKFLWFVRLAKTRNVAQAIVTAGRIRVAGRIIERAHAQVHVGDILTFPLHGRVRVIRVEAIPERRGPAPEAQSCYTDLAPATEAIDIAI